MMRLVAMVALVLALHFPAPQGVWLTKVEDTCLGETGIPFFDATASRWITSPISWFAAIAYTQGAIVKQPASIETYSTGIAASE